MIATVALLASSANAAVEPPQVTVIGDSVLTAIEWNAEPLAVLEDGFQMQLEIGICRRLTGESCPSDGARVPTLVEVVDSLGSQLGKVVLVEVGYNDDHDTFAQNVELSIQALLHTGVQHILWANLHGFGQQWIDMNHDLAAAASRHPEVTIIDWNDYASNHWSWFQGDAIHLVHEGAMAMATMFHTAIEKATDPVTIAPAPLPVARVRQKYAARFAVSGGQAPYTWRVVGGALPRGLHLRPDGSIDGVPKRSGKVKIVVRVVDGRGIPATKTELLRVDSVG
jgi:hypothetical protein